MIEFENANPKNVSKEMNKPPYLLGLLGFIPLVGFFVGIGLTLYGLIKYKDKKLIIIGVLCMVFTVFVYSFMYFGIEKSSKVRESWAELSQYQVNELVKDIEYFKLENGKYPDSLKQLQNGDTLVNIQDPIKGLNSSEKDIFIYENLGDKYSLYSVGLDGVAKTKDDIFPNVKSDSKVGWIKEIK